MIYYYKNGSLYKTSIIYLHQLYIIYILGLFYQPIFFLFLVRSIIPILLYWSTLVYQSIQILGLLDRPSFLILVFFFLGCSTIRIIFLIYFFFWSPIADQYFIPLFIFWAYILAQSFLFNSFYFGSLY